MYQRTITATVPIRICDLGGWTDTWFAGHGVVCSLAVNPGVVVQVRLSTRQRARQAVHLVVHNYGESLHYPGDTPRHPLLHVAIATNPIPDAYDAEIAVSSDIPPGCSTGTSAAVSVALIGALRAAQGHIEPPAKLSRAAHLLETQELGLQSGIQDQIGVAHGGCCYIEMAQYPDATVSAVPLTETTIAALNDQLLLFYVGTPHLSSAIHQQVIARLKTVSDMDTLLDPLRLAAVQGGTALRAGDLQAYGHALQANTDAQRRLHPGLIAPQAEKLIELADAHGAWGCKVNGAGGDGGSLAVLTSPDPTERAAFVRAVTTSLPRMQQIAITYAPHGIHITDREA
jgi:D-glycero-alpha-D-manno-heptose-7-phosphate kinase